MSARWTAPGHPDDTPVTDPDLAPVQSLVADLKLAFVTVDLVLRADGWWRVVEIGDGQVSDRRATITPDAMITLLHGSSH